jgi:hypothetical protein
MRIFDRVCLLCLYSIVYNLSDDNFVKAETCRNDTIDDKLVFIIDNAVCWTEYWSR